MQKSEIYYYFVADKKSVVADSLGALRLHLGKELELIDESKFNFLWVIDWPLLSTMKKQDDSLLRTIHSQCQA